MSERYRTVRAVVSRGLKEEQVVHRPHGRSSPSVAFHSISSTKQIPQTLSSRPLTQTPLRRSNCALTQQNCTKQTPAAADRQQTRRTSRMQHALPTRCTSSLVLFCCMVVLAFLCGPVAADNAQEGLPLAVDLEHRTAAHEERRLDRRSHLIFDRSEPPVAPRLQMLAARDAAPEPAPIPQDEEASTTELVFTLQTSPPSSSSSKQAATTTTVVVSTTSSVPSDLSTATALPQPFDQNLGNNFTAQSPCPGFFNSFLQSSAFQACAPLSLLLQTSKGFFDAAHSFVRITQILDATCNVNVAKCNALMADLAYKIKLDSVCGPDYIKENPYVRQAYNGFVSYKMEYEAGCAKDAKGSYCFANAITNTSSPADAYIYYLPLDNALTGGARPTCNTCLEKTMNIFAPGAKNSSLPLSRTYRPAASSVNMICGPDFVNSTVSSSGVRNGGSGVGLAGMMAVVGLVSGLSLL